MSSSRHRRYSLLSLAIAISVGFWVLEGVTHVVLFGETNPVHAMLPHDANEFWMRSLVCLLLVAFGGYAERAARRLEASHRRETVTQLRLERALVRSLNGFVPVCAWCKKIREGEGSEGRWEGIESYLEARTEVSFSRTVCPECTRKVEAEFQPGLE